MKKTVNYILFVCILAGFVLMPHQAEITLAQERLIENTSELQPAREQKGSGIQSNGSCSQLDCFGAISSTFLLRAHRPVGVAYRAHVKRNGNGWLPWVSNGATAGTTGQSRRMEALKVKLLNPRPGMHIKYRAYVKGNGWLPWVSNGAKAGTTGQSRRAEAFQIKLVNAPAGMRVTYRVHVKGKGWLPWVSNGATAGTTGHNRRAEAIQIRIIP